MKIEEYSIHKSVRDMDEEIEALNQNIKQLKRNIWIKQTQKHIEEHPAHYENIDSYVVEDKKGRLRVLQILKYPLDVKIRILNHIHQVSNSIMLDIPYGNRSKFSDIFSSDEERNHAIGSSHHIFTHQMYEEEGDYMMLHIWIAGGGELWLKISMEDAEEVSDYLKT